MTSDRNALLEILDQLELDKVILVGNSMGCPVILEVAHAGAARVRPGRACRHLHEGRRT